MQKHESTVIEYEAPIALAEYEYFYTEYKDGLSLVEAIAVCHLNDWPYPTWIRNALGVAMTELYESTFPDAETKDHKAEIKILQNDFDYEDTKYAFDRYKKAQKRFLKNLHLNLDRDNLIEAHKRTKRDQELADLIAGYTQYSHTPKPSFSGAYAVIDALTEALGPLIAVVMGVTTASVGGIIRDVVGGEQSIIMHREIYVTAAVAGGVTYIGLAAVELGGAIAAIVSFLVTFIIRGLAITYNWSLPARKASI